jgi:hypothetical protein
MLCSAVDISQKVGAEHSVMAAVATLDRLLVTWRDTSSTMTG